MAARRSIWIPVLIVDSFLLVLLVWAGERPRPLPAGYKPFVPPPARTIELPPAPDDPPIQPIPLPKLPWEH